MPKITNIIDKFIKSSNVITISVIIVSVVLLIVYSIIKKTNKKDNLGE